MHEDLYTKWGCNTLGITSLKQKREERRFVDLIIILILHCGNEFLKRVLNFCFKLDDNVPRYGSTIKRSFLGTVGEQKKKFVHEEREVCLKKILWIAP